MSHKIELVEGAFVVADAHYSHKRPQFLDFLNSIYTKELNPPQLILVGDIFDALFGEVSFTHRQNQEAIEILNAISNDIEVIYLEGNHDFNLKNIFKNIKIFPITSQPIELGFKDKKILFAHGDINNTAKYNTYTKIIRSNITLTLLAFIDSILNHKILKKLDEYLSKKNDCKDFTGFEDFILQRLSNKYICNYFIEGHFHQNRVLNIDNFTYINLGAFACNQRYYVVQSSLQTKKLLEENFFKG